MGAFKDQKIKQDEPQNPTILADLQQEGLAVFCWCNRCGHNAEIAVERFLSKVDLTFPVPELGQIMRCQNCQANDIATRPAWPSYGGQMARHG